MKEYVELPTIREVVAKLGKAQYFSVLDLKDSFWHVSLDAQSSLLCTFSTVFGSYHFNRLPFGLNISTEVFQKYNTEKFGDIDGVIIYVDDLLIFAEDEQTHDRILTEVLLRARKCNVKFNLKKFQYKVNEAQYVGHTFKNGLALV